MEFPLATVSNNLLGANNARETENGLGVWSARDVADRLRAHGYTSTSRDTANLSALTGC